MAFDTILIQFGLPPFGPNDVSPNWGLVQLGYYLNGLSPNGVSPNDPSVQMTLVQMGVVLELDCPIGVVQLRLVQMGVYLFIQMTVAEMKQSDIKHKNIVEYSIRTSSTLYIYKLSLINLSINMAATVVR